MNQQVKFRKAATLEFQALEGRPTAATLTIKTCDLLDLTTAVVDATATVDPVNTTVDAACGKSQDNPRQIKLAATTSIRIGGRYLLTGAQGSERAEIMGIASGDYVTARNPLKYDYAPGATFVGTRLTYALTAGNAQSPDGDCDTDFRAEWTYTVDGETYIRETLYDVTRHPWFRMADEVGLKRWNRDLLSRWEEEGNTDWNADLDEAFARIIEIAEANGWYPGAILGMDKLAVATYWQLAFTKALGGSVPPHSATDPADWLDRCERELGKALDIAEKTITWIDKDQDNEKDAQETGAALRVKRLSP